MLPVFSVLVFSLGGAGRTGQDNGRGGRGFLDLAFRRCL
jgi:hypothetical protein